MAYKHFFKKEFSRESFDIKHEKEDLKPISPYVSHVVAPPCLAVITSGGDSPGMNPAVRGIVRGALHQGYKVYAVQDGYLGLCRGNDDDIVPIQWHDVRGILNLGGTFLGTARCADFRESSGRKKVTRNLISRGINHLIIVGGDGSLTGASILQKEWKGFVTEILEEENKKPSWFTNLWNGRESDIYSLHVVGLVGSIDNDMGNTSMTIGCDSALHRICTAVDILSSTAASHHRVFVVEVMGRKCGWLALNAALACGADYVFIPEYPQALDWQQEVITAVTRSNEDKKRCSIIIVAEGAQDINMNKISTEDIRKVLADNGSDTRVTILGHVQRGGSPSFYDRAESMLLGYAAVQEMVKGTAKKEPQMICVDGLLHVRTRPLSECLGTCNKITAAIAESKFTEAMELRGNHFIRAFNVMCSLVTAKREVEIPNLHNIALLHVGACSPGMNTLARAFVRLALDKGFATYGISGSIFGLESGELHLMNWVDVDGWSPLGGAKLGTSRFDYNNMNLAKICYNLQKYNISTLAMMGGWDGYECMMHLKKQSHLYPFLKKLNILLVPCTISNNLPFTDYSIGADSALNSIIDSVDKIKESAIAQRRIFVIEVMGAHCGFLCSMGAFATGAEKSFEPEEEPTLESLQGDVKDVKESFKHGKAMALFFTTEKTSKVFDTKFLAKLFQSQSDGKYDVRVSILGHLQQGGKPSPMDRYLGTSIVGKCIERIEEYVKDGKEDQFVAVGLIEGKVLFSPGSEIESQMDMKHRRPLSAWWTKSFGYINKQYAEWREKPDVYQTHKD